MADIIPEAKIMQYLDTFNRIADKKVIINLCSEMNLVLMGCFLPLVLMGGGGLLVKTIEKVNFLIFFSLVKYSQFSYLTGVSTDLVSPRP